MATAPIAAADTPSLSGIGDVPVPAVSDLVTPGVGYTNEFTIGLGSTEETFTTMWDGAGAPTTTELTATLPTGDEGFGFSDIALGDLSVGADTYGFQLEDSLFDLLTPTSNTLDLLLPVLDLITNF
jgi:hypothetical protein